jgi:glycogen(starch) synthase
MKILMLGWELPPHNSGGLGVACLQMSKALSLQGASIDFVVPYSAAHTEITHMNVLSATELKPTYQYGFGAYDSYVYKKEVDIQGGMSLREIQADYKTYITSHLKTTDESYDAIHIHDWLTMEAGILAKELTGLPLIAHVHATEFDRAGSQRGNPLVHDIEQNGLLIADRIIAVSEITKNIIVHRYGIPADKVEVMHNALSYDDLRGYDYDRRTYQHLESLKSHGYTVVATITRFTVQKGLTHLMNAAARASERYDKLLFLFAGDGEQRDELLRLSAELGIADKVYFTGFVRGKQWRDAYQVADVFVMSSVSEPFGLTALEAAFFNNALILTRQSGVSEILRNVYTYDFWDVDALADRLVTLADSTALQVTMKNNLKVEYEALSWDTVAVKCMQLYRGIHTRRSQYV